MEIFVYREGGDTVEDGFTVEMLPDLLKDDKALIWVDMEGPSEADDRVLLDVFHFHPLTVEDSGTGRKSRTKGWAVRALFVWSSGFSRFRLKSVLQTKDQGSPFLTGRWKQQ